MGNYLTFDGLKTSDYGVEISGEGIFNSPERIYDMIEIPGRNGTLALDQGRYANVEVKYPAYNYETTLATFEQKLASLRSDFGSRIGYKRLTDTFHTDEYRLGVFKGGFEIDPVKYNTASQFELVFDCKPQRFLTSGETATAVANNGTINNPTKFDAQPLLEFKGYGKIAFNNKTIGISNAPPGLLTLKNAFTDEEANGAFTLSGSYSLDANTYATGDSITIASGTKVRFRYTRKSIYDIQVTGIYGSAIQNILSAESGFINLIDSPYSVGLWLEITLDAIGFVAGTSSSKTCSYGLQFTYKLGGTTYTENPTLSAVFSYDGVTNIITYTISETNVAKFYGGEQLTAKATTVDSTKQVTSTIYVDLEIDEAYTYDNGSLIGLNNIVSIPNIPPVLPSGNTTVTYDNTITNFKITPRWWRL